MNKHVAAGQLSKIVKGIVKMSRGEFEGLMVKRGVMNSSLGRKRLGRWQCRTWR